MKEEELHFQVFFDYVESVFQMTEADKQSCRKHMFSSKVSKDGFLSEEGKIPEYHNFIVSGYVRNYHYDENHDEVTVDLNDGPRFFTSYTHFINRTISNEILQCVTDCEILRLRRDDLENMANTFPSLNKYSTLIIQTAWQDMKQRLIERTTLSAEERYLKLMKEKPMIIKNFPLKQIASYLGIQPGSLSRIRKEVMEASN